MLSFILCLLIALASLYLILVSEKLFGRLINPMSLYCATWGAVHFLYQLRLLPYRPLAPITLLVFGLGHLGFFLGVSTFAFSFSRFRRRMSIRYIPGWCNERALRKWLMLLAPLGIASVGIRLLLFLTIAKVSLVQMLANPSAARIAMVAAENAAQETTFTLALRGVAVVLGASLFLGLVIGGVHLALHRRRSIWPYVPLALGILQSMTNFARSGAVQSAFIFASAFTFARQFDKEKLGRARDLKRILRISLIAALCLVIVFYVVEQSLGKIARMEERTQGNPIIMHTYWYFSGGMPALDAYLEVHQDAALLKGVSTFRMAAKWLVRAGILGPEARRPQFREHIIVPGPDLLRNTFTWLVFFYEDFGLVGVLVLSYLSGSISSVLYRVMLKKFTLTLVAINALLWLTIVWSFHGFGLTETQKVLEVALAFVAAKFLAQERQTAGWRADSQSHLAGQRTKS